MAENAGATHAALVLLKEPPAQDFKLKVTAITKQQYHLLNPNPWEVLWIFFNYNSNDDNKTKTTNYFTWKKTEGYHPPNPSDPPPQEIELGQAYDKIGQTFVEGSYSNSLSLKQAVTYTLEKRGNTLKIWLDDKLIMTHIYDETKDKKLYNSKGSIGLYVEDAEVVITNVEYVSYDD